MKRWFGLGLTLAVMAVWVSGTWAGMIGPSLQGILNRAGPDQKIPVAIALKQQADNAALERACVGKTKEQRWAYVVGELKKLSEVTQRELLSSLASSEASGQVERVTPLWIVNEVYCEATPSAIQALAARPEVWFVDYDLVPASLETENAGKPATGVVDRKVPGVKAASGGQRLPGVTTVEPNVHLVGADSVWNLLGYTGNGVIVGHIDTGSRYTHMDLRNHMWTSSAYPNHGYNYASSQLWGSRGNAYDTLNPMDYNGHGTHTAGIVSADGNYGNGVHDTMGIAPKAKILSTPVLVNLVSPYPDTILEISCFDAFQFCISPPRDPTNHANVFTFSIGLIDAWLPRRAIWRQAETNIMNAGIVHCVAAGNEGPGNRTLRTPGNVPGPWHHPAEEAGGRSGVVTIGATDNTDAAASFTSWGPARWDTVAPYNDYPDPPGLLKPDVSAPGYNITSTYDTGDSAYTQMSGTSMATPCAAGVVALMLSKNPTLLPWQVDSILQMTVRPLGYSPKNDTFGTGRVSAYQAVLHTPAPYAQFRLASVAADTMNTTATKTDSITVSSVSSFNLPVTMTLDSIRPATGTITVGFNPNPVTPPANGSIKTGMQITTAATPSNNYVLYYHAHGDTITRLGSLNLWVTAPTFVMQSTPRVQSIFSADSASFADTLVSISGFSSPCTLSAAVSPPAPTITVSFIPNNIVVPTGGCRMKVQTTGATVAQGYAITITARSGATVKTLVDSLYVKYPVQGPDSYGYYAYDNTDVGFLNSPVYSWVEINPNRGGAGTTVGTGGDDVTYQQAMTGIGVKHYGTNFATASICSNGWLAMGTTTSVVYINTTIPSTTFVPDGIAPFWDDMMTNQTGNTWWYYRDLTNHRFVVEWDSISHYANTANRETFEVLVNDTTLTPSTARTHDSEIIIQWKLVTDISSMTVGQQNTAMTVGLNSYANGVYDPQMAPIAAGRATKYTTDPPRPVSGVEMSPLANPAMPTRFALGPAVPNPSSGGTMISYDLPTEAQVSLKVYNLSGQLVRTLASGKEQAGYKHASWDGRSDNGSHVSSGVYFYRIEAGSFTATKKMVVVR